MQIVPYTALTGYKNIIVSLRHARKEKQLNFDSSAITVNEDAGTISLDLSQEQTAFFPVGEVTVQVNVLFDDNARNVTAQESIMVLENIYDEVMT